MSDKTRSAVFITAEDLRTLSGTAPNLVILDVRELAETVEGVPGAIQVSPGSFAGAGGGLRGARPLPHLGDIQDAARRWGVDDASQVVLYDDKGGLQAARGWWVLRWAGVKDVRLLDGGLVAWRAADYALDKPLGTASTPGTVTLSAGHLPTLDADLAAEYARTAVLIDARGAKAFSGDPIVREGGHIPGSINVPASGNLLEDGRFASQDALRTRYARFISGDSKPIGVTCGSGVSAAHDIAALASIGIEAALFPGSWSAWSADPNRPVAYG
jgi:thiosulfate/3-mercaptopyruvate sulfurtransferase